MKHIVSISLGTSMNDFEFQSTYLDQEFHIKRIGTNNDYEKVISLMHQWDTKADAIGLGGIYYPEPQMKQEGLINKLIHSFSFDQGFQKIMNEIENITTPVYTGFALMNVAHEWTIRHIQFEMKNYFTNARVLFLSGILNYRMAQVLSDFTENITCADPIIDHGIPKFLNSFNDLDLYSTGVHKILKIVNSKRIVSFASPISSFNNQLIKKAVKNSFIVVIPSIQFYEYANLFSKGDLQGKIVISSNIYDERLEFLKTTGADVIIDTTPLVLDRPVSVNTIEAMITTALNRKTEKLTDEDLLEIISLRGRIPKPRIIYPGGKPKRTNRFAFVVHPLSQENFKLEKSIKPFLKIPGMLDLIEKGVAYAPPWIYSKVSGIQSPQGVETEGWLISVGGTPKQMMTHTPEFTYKRLLQASKIAKNLGAQIMGLGAFTKVVGDAGLTVSKKAELPITTGNSYSASGALWAAADAARRMGLLEVGEDKKIKGKSMVFGATGAIGSVCCRLLAMAFEEVTLCGRNPIKLLSLKESIEKETPGATIHMTVNPDSHLKDMDVIVTATSGMGKKILDITRVKPGCIITDVARPLDLPPSEVAKRPDVLVIESGEILLPGDNVQMKNIGLPDKVAYACLAETIVLALEGKFETFTIGRDIEWEKVKEIYKLGIKHGMALAAISGVNGVFCDEDIQNVKRLALEARENITLSTP